MEARGGWESGEGGRPRKGFGGTERFFSSGKVSLRAREVRFPTSSRSNSIDRRRKNVFHHPPCFISCLSTIHSAFPFLLEKRMACLDPSSLSNSALLVQVHLVREKRAGREEKRRRKARASFFHVSINHSSKRQRLAHQNISSDLDPPPPSLSLSPTSLSTSTSISTPVSFTAPQPSPSGPPPRGQPLRRKESPRPGSTRGPST